MQKIGDLLTYNHVPTNENVNVEKEISNNVYDDNVAFKIRDAVDKPRAIGQILAEKLNAPHNVKFYIKLAQQYSVDVLFESVALTNEMWNEGRIRTTKAQYFYGILRKKAKNHE